MTNVHESAIAWLHKQLKSKEMGLYRALHKVNASEKEIENLEDAIEVIEYIIKKLEES
jgi:DNA transposition AAA+ family ATPase